MGSETAEECHGGIEATERKARGQDMVFALPKRIAPDSALERRMNWLLVEAVCIGMPPRTRART
jgi:hypothetical protein